MAWLSLRPDELMATSAPRRIMSRQFGRDADVGGGSTAAWRALAHASLPSWSVSVIAAVGQMKSERIRTSGSPPS